MRCTSVTFVSVFLGASFAFAGPTLSLRNIEKNDGPTTGEHIVMLKRGVSRQDFFKRLGLNATAEFGAINSFSGMYF